MLPDGGQNLWLPAAVDLTSGQMAVKFRAVHGGVNTDEPFADIAIDDIMVSVLYVPMMTSLTPQL